MSSLLLAKATVRSVIEHAYRVAPASFVAHMQQLARQHNEFADRTLDFRARIAARNLSDSCQVVADLLDNQGTKGVDTIMRELDLYVPAFGGACQILDLPFSWRAQIVAQDPAVA